MAIARHLVISGRVQGVWFRAWTKEQADRLGVTGWVRNRADGSVEANIEGSDESVAALIGELRSGPPAAAVSNVEDNPAEPCGASAFEVRH